MICKRFSWIFILYFGVGLNVCVFAKAPLKKMRKKVYETKESKRRDKPYIEPYGMAGCGFGSILIKRNNKFLQLLAMSFNTIGFQSFAISSGTSNCKATRADFYARNQRVFIETNLASLAKDAARGEGEYLAAAAEVFGCDKNLLPIFYNVSRENFQIIFSSQYPLIVLGNYLKTLKANQRLSGECRRIGV